MHGFCNEWAEDINDYDGHGYMAFGAKDYMVSGIYDHNTKKWSVESFNEIDGSSIPHELYEILEKKSRITGILNDLIRQFEGNSTKR